MEKHYINCEASKKNSFPGEDGHQRRTASPGKMGIKEEQLPRGRWKSGSSQGNCEASKKNSYHTAARAWARWTIDAESMRDSEAPTPSRRCRRSWTIGDRFTRCAENRIGRPPRRYGCRAELRKKSSLQGLACEVLAIYESIKEEQLPPIRV